MNYCILVLISAIFVVPVYGTQSTISDANIDVVVNYPDVVAPGNEFVLSTVVKTKADQMSNITLAVSSPEMEILQNLSLFIAGHMNIASKALLKITVPRMKKKFKDSHERSSGITLYY